MANVFFTQGREQIVLQNLSLTGEASLKMMLVDTTYAPDIDNSFVTDGGAGSAANHEISVTGYTGGFGGGGRKTFTNRTFARVDANDRVEFHFSNITWAALGGAAGIGGAVMIVEKTSDADSWLVAFWDTNNITTNGSDVVFVPDSTGAFYF